MDALPEVALSAVLEFSDCAALLAFEHTGRQFHYAVRAQGLWERLARRAVAMSENDEPATAVEWKLLTHLATRRVDRSNSLLDNVTGCSSVDHPEESPLNTLTTSPCWMTIQSIPQPIIEPISAYLQNIGVNTQISCQCQDAIPCYWSSTPSTDSTTQDFIDYTVVPRSLVHLVLVIPYRAFWHPHAPTYGPLAVSFQFYSIRSAAAITSAEKEVLYESPVFPLHNRMEQNEFLLPKPLWLPTGAIMRLNFLGRHQAQTVDLMMQRLLLINDVAPEYYTCISHVGAIGVVSVLRQSLLERQSAKEEEQQHLPSFSTRKRRLDDS